MEFFSNIYYLLKNKISNNKYNIKEERYSPNIHVCNSCPITMENFTTNDIISILPCNHIFSKNAIQEWLKKHTTCPICRYEVYTNMFYFREELYQPRNDFVSYLIELWITSNYN